MKKRIKKKLAKRGRYKKYRNYYMFSEARKLIELIEISDIIGNYITIEIKSLKTNFIICNKGYKENIRKRDIKIIINKIDNFSNLSTWEEYIFFKTIRNYFKNKRLILYHIFEDHKEIKIIEV